MLLTFLEFLAVISAAIYGVLLARRTGMDFIGVFSVAFMIAFGGGTLRDLFLDRIPLFWIGNPHYPVVVFFLALGLSLIRYPDKLIERILPYPDALGLGLFSVVGTAYALEAPELNPLMSDMSWFNAALFGVITGTFGGVIGDVVCNRVPSLFQPSTPLYATTSFVGSWVYILLIEIDAPEGVAVAVGIAVVVFARLAAIRWNICLPDLSHGKDDAL